MPALPPFPRVRLGAHGEPEQINVNIGRITRGSMHGSLTWGCHHCHHILLAFAGFADGDENTGLDPRISKLVSLKDRADVP
jgi:hypothetical protein